MNEPSPRISVIIPAFNASRYIGSALDCVMEQQASLLEIIVVDDGSTDDTAAIAARHPLRVQVVRQDNGGPGAARNKGLEVARAPLITFLDVDDKWPAGSLAVRLEALESHPEMAMVMGCVRFEGMDGREIPLPAWAAPNLGAGLYRRQVFQKVGIFEPSLLLDDVDWFWRTRDEGIPTMKLEGITLHYRRHPESLTAAKTWIELGMGTVIRRALARRDPGRLPATSADLANPAGRR